ncbi:2977_t:CDS:2 [Paraglomus occultum]|uniref:2977_t:CDS:1 n=1 Tax=Paraglomus occultum TaxID=144539 RepID=A0A9N9B1M9_9GLOM|nr:2977_t:CDS:2 [Paraglomus occultum]
MTRAVEIVIAVLLAYVLKAEHQEQKLYRAPYAIQSQRKDVLLRRVRHPRQNQEY